MKTKSIIIAIALLGLLFYELPAAAHLSEEDALQKEAREIFGLIMCPLCAGQTIGQSNNETSRQMRDLVIKMLREGETRDGVLRYFESRYGQRILALPNKKGFNLVLWALPFVAVVLAAIAVYVLIRRWSARAQVAPADSYDEDQLAGYKERLEKELEHFDRG